jgi:hypothetical protein
MRRFRIVVGCVLVALATSGIFAAGALARKHVNKGEIHFRWTSGPAVLELQNNPAKLECKSTNTGTKVGEDFFSEGSIDTPRFGGTAIVFEGCEMAAKKCQSKKEHFGRYEGEGRIFSDFPLDFETGYIVGTSSKAVGIDFYPHNGIAEPDLMIFECPGTPDIFVRVKGSVSGRVEPLNVMGLKSKVVLNQSGGVQEVEGIENKEAGVPDGLTTEISFTGETGKTESFRSALSFTAEVETHPQEVEKRKKKEYFVDPVELKTGGSLPEYGRCQAKKKGRYAEGNCNTLARGKVKGTYEFVPVK